MTHQITIPTSQKLARHLGQVDALMTAKRWERAAIVYAFTTDESKGGRPAANAHTSGQVEFPVSISQFAKLGYAGLGSRTTVAAYRKAWVQAITEGYAEPTAPGEPVELPDENEHPWQVAQEAPVEPIAPASLSLVPAPEQLPLDGQDDGESGQDRESYTDAQDRMTYAPEPEEEDTEPREPRKVPSGARPQARIELTRVDDVDYVAAKIVEIGADYGTLPLNTWLRRIAAQLAAQADVLGRGDQEDAAAQTA